MSRLTKTLATYCKLSSLIFNDFLETPMYTVAVTRDFIANHFLVGGDWGAENFPHAHNYVAEISIQGNQLDQHGYLVDIVDIEAALDKTVH